MKVLKILGFVFGGIGLAMLVAAFAIYANTQSFADSATRADGVVIGLAQSQSHSSKSSSYFPVIQYQTSSGETTTFQSNSGSSPPAFEVGERVTVLYDPAQPADASIDSFWQLYALPAIFGIIGLVFFAVGGGMFIAHMLNRRKREQLLASGRRITTQVQGVVLNTNVRINGRHPFCITSQWLNPDTGNVHVFRSDGVWFDPSSHIQGGSIDVLIDPVNPKRYHVDTSFLPKEA
ncbi:MAG: DUF3592 domain-containing protein [bacterium]|nr:DUF3592 domain-containing protein [Candidatus Kapabacteria bacterium]